MSAVLTPTRSAVHLIAADLLRLGGAKTVAWFKAIYVRKLIASAEDDTAHLQAEYDALPARIKHHEQRAAELRVELALLEKI